MALTQSARIPGLGPSWDEEVVPALRKRLESESRTLARRISAVSVSSAEGSPDDTAYRQRTVASPTFSVNSNKTNATTRPSNGRNASDHTINSARVNGNVNGTSSRPSSRSRTYSQPYSPAMNGSTSGFSRTKASDSLSISSSIRPVSPAQAKPSRIPQPTRNRADSVSSYSHSITSPSLNGHNGSAYRSPRTPTPGDVASPSDLWVVHEKSSASTVSVKSHPQQVVLLNEPAPFKADSATSSNMYSSKESFHTSHDDLDDTPPRPSTESEERPFEHWYRGEVSRNGGVGEYRVAKRQEMLEIATYGHSLQKPAVRNAITDAIDQRRRMRRRADSTSGVVGERASFYMDEEQAKEAARVLDEGPLTDLDGETSDYEADNASDYYDPIEHMNTTDVDMSTSSAPLPSTSDYDPRSTTPTPSNLQRPSSRTQHSASRLPRSTTPTAPIQRGLSEPPSMPSTSTSLPSTPKTSRTRPAQASQLKSPASSSTSTPQSRQKRERGNSPSSPGSVMDSSKKSRLAASKATQAKLAKKKEVETDASRRSIAYYPEPGDDMIYAIPTWTQPVPKAGNWDDVVLPVVARKKGLDGLYEQADGSPRAKQTENTVAPAPGTFGYDHSKYRPPRQHGESLPMDEFGQTVVQEDQEEPESPQRKQRPLPPPVSTAHDETRLPARPEPPMSPMPFSHYVSNSHETITTQQPIPLIAVNGDLEQGRNAQKDEEDDAGGGCCKCIVM